jgi:hypothetical protein
MVSGRLAIIGAGSGGLVTLKQAVDQLPGWEIVCLEKGNNTRGAWGNPYPGFVSTSTKFTTQFSCFRKWDTRVDPADRASMADFFRGDEYGRYLEEFVEKYQLERFIRLHSNVRRIVKDPSGWRLTIDDGNTREDVFDQLIICTGLVGTAKSIDTSIPCLRSTEPPVTNKTIVVIGGGESGVDLAHRLADPELGNRVFLSLKNGVRVSPRYHPIRGVPSDFLRNRLLLSIHQDLRNAIGQKFVEARIRHQEIFEKFFRSHPDRLDRPASILEKRKFWDAKLTERAKDNLFNVFHTKSDQFLDDVAEDRIHIIGPPRDETHGQYFDFDGGRILDVNPDLICPMIGYTAGLTDLSNGEIKVSDFHLGCLHVHQDNLFLVGFTRPIIGNIPTISEMQAKLVIGMIAGRWKRPFGTENLHARARNKQLREFPSLNTETIYPVEMFPYCDILARLMDAYPSLRKVGSLSRWLKIQLSPASTMHYVDDDYDAQSIDAHAIHSPPVITMLLTLIKLIDWPYRLVKGETE